MHIPPWLFYYVILTHKDFRVYPEIKLKPSYHSKPACNKERYFQEYIAHKMKVNEAQNNTGPH